MGDFELILVTSLAEYPTITVSSSVKIKVLPCRITSEVINPEDEHENPYNYTISNAGFNPILLKNF